MLTLSQPEVRKDLRASSKTYGGVSRREILLHLVPERRQGFEVRHPRDVQVFDGDADVFDALQERLASFSYGQVRDCSAESALKALVQRERTSTIVASPCRPSCNKTFASSEQIKGF